MSLRSSRFDDRITASSNPSVRGEANLVPGRVATETIGGRSYRAVAARLVPENGIGARGGHAELGHRRREALGDRAAPVRPGRIAAADRVRGLPRRPLDRRRPRPARRGCELDRCRPPARARSGQGPRRVRRTRARVQRDGGAAGGPAGGSRGRAPAAARRERPLRRRARIRARSRPAPARDRRVGRRGDAGRRRRRDQRGRLGDRDRRHPPGLGAARIRADRGPAQLRASASSSAPPSTTRSG